MNVTQKSITMGFTIGHSKQTIISLLEHTKFQITELGEINKGNIKSFNKLERIRLSLETSLVQVKETEKLINNIDD